MQSVVQSLVRRTRKWDMRHWLTAGLIFQIIMVLLTELAMWLWPEKKPQSPDISFAESMSFVEFNEKVEDVKAETKDLSDEIIETDRITDDKPINWDNAADPALDITQRYQPSLLVNISRDDYPDRARRANAGRVDVAVTLYISADGRIRDVRIRNIRTQSGSADSFKPDFIQAVRRILLTQSRMTGKPYTQNGRAVDFTWDTTVTFTLE